MTSNELEARILSACQGTTSTSGGDTKRAVLTMHWLRTVAASDQGIIDSNHSSIVKHRATLRRANLLPFDTAYKIADVAEGLGVLPDDTAALIRLAWVLRRRPVGISFARSAESHAGVVAQASQILRRRALPER
jgi:hypothetical protein